MITEGEEDRGRERKIAIFAEKLLTLKLLPLNFNP